MPTVHHVGVSRSDGVVRLCEELATLYARVSGEFRRNEDYFLARLGGERLTVRSDHSVQDINRKSVLAFWNSLRRRPS